MFHARPLRNGRTFRVRWTDDDLRRDGTQVAEEFLARFVEEYQHLVHRVAVLQGALPEHGETTPARIAELVENAVRGAARVDPRLRDARRASAPARVVEDDA